MLRLRVLVSGIAIGGLTVASLIGSTAGAEPAPMAPPVAVTGDAGVAAVPDELTFFAVLPYNAKKLRRAALRVSTPDSLHYRGFFTVPEARERFAATREARRELRRTAQELGLTAQIDGTGLFARVTGPTEVWEDLYGRSAVVVSGDEVSLGPIGTTSTIIPASMDDMTRLAQEVPEALRGVARAVIPESLEWGPPPAFVWSAPVARASQDDSPPVNEGSPFGAGEECLTELGLSRVLPYTYSHEQLQTAYGTADLRDSGYDGVGARLAILGIGQAFDPVAAIVSADCFEYGNTSIVTLGASGLPDEPIPGPGSDPDLESDLDIQTSAAVLDGDADITFVEAQGGVSFVRSALDVYSTALVRATPDVTSLSYGECIPEMESFGDWTYARYGDDMFAFAALLGTSVLVAAGDSGSSGCLHGGGSSDAVAPVWPGGSPWVTSVGGTRIVLGAGNVRVNEVTWNDMPFGGGPGAGGGGVTSYPRPAYQGAITSADRRLFPDLAVHASDMVGWPIFYTGTPGDLDSLSFTPIGGTSAASPFTAANLALIIAAERAAGRPALGFLNPWLYAIADGPYEAAFYDVVNGTNQVVPTAGCCRASAGYDMATGLGAPNFYGLAALVNLPGPRAG